jgi:hypothetical protein|tara:strand:+ start:1119 stop:1295 length:177 start_codon:yes stop_codon:yes gene_type:complete
MKDQKYNTNEEKMIAEYIANGGKVNVIEAGVSSSVDGEPIVNVWKRTKKAAAPKKGKK